jgi:hypothetical protein
MRPAVIVFAPLMLLPFLACDSALTEPDPDAAVTELQQPAAPTADAAFQLGPQFGGEWWDDKHGFGYGGPHQDAAIEEDASMADADAAAGGEGIPKKKKVRAQKGRVSTDEVTEGSHAQQGKGPGPFGQGGNPN